MYKVKRYHNAEKPFELDRSRKYNQAVTFKPRGLWFGFGNAWIEWCRSEMPQWVRQHTYEVEPNGANILMLKTEADFLAFNREYKADYYEEDGRRIEGMKILLGIDWPKLASEYAGIEIPVYLWKFRLHPEFMWFYGWDCASGCIWNVRDIELRHVKTNLQPNGYMKMRK